MAKKEHVLYTTEMPELDTYLKKWQLSKPVKIASTFTCDIYKVKFKNELAVLKILNIKGQKNESKGAEVLKCFDGNGAVKLFNYDAGAQLLEFIDGPLLKSLVDDGKDEMATEIICEVVEKIHSYSGPCPPELISMERNFKSLLEMPNLENENGLFKRGAILARELISTPTDLRVLHGDLHHENILKHPIRGWLVIDPQCLFGERTYDLANIFYNPNGFTELAASSQRIDLLSNIFSQRLGLDRMRILKYAFAYGCLSACWFIEDGQSPDDTLLIAKEIEQFINQYLEH